MAITARVGAITSVNALAANQMPDVDRVLYLLKSYQTPLFNKLYFTQGEGKAQVVTNENGKFDWMEDQYYFYQTTFTSTGTGGTGAAASLDNILLTDSSWINEGDILFIEQTDQMVYVDSIASSEIDITSLDGTTLIQNATTGYVRKLGSYNHEFATARTAVSTVEEEVTNRCTILSETVTSSGRRQAGAKYTNGKSHKDEMKKKIEEMKQEAERMFMFSNETNTRTISSAYRVTWGKGFYGMISTTKVPYETMTDTVLEEYISTVFASGDDVRDHYVGNTQLIDLRKILKDKWNLDVERVTEYNVKCNRFVTDWGVLNVIRNPRMEGKFVKYGFTIAPNHQKMRYMADDETGSRKFRIEENVQTPGTDGKSDKILMDIGYQLSLEKECGYLYKTS